MPLAMYRDCVYKIAAKLGFDTAHLVKGGDHLGPNLWQHLDATCGINDSRVGRGRIYKGPSGRKHALY